MGDSINKLLKRDLRDHHNYKTKWGGRFCLGVLVSPYTGMLWKLLNEHDFFYGQEADKAQGTAECVIKVKVYTRVQYFFSIQL